MMKKWQVAETVTAVGEQWYYLRPGDEVSRPHQVRVLAIETANILVEFVHIPEMGTGRRRWMSHDAFSLGVRARP